MEVFGIIGFSFGAMGFTFGLIAFTTALTSSNKVKELEKRIDDLEEKSWTKSQEKGYFNAIRSVAHCTIGQVSVIKDYFENLNI